jgi:mycothiol synthase
VEIIEHLDRTRRDELVAFVTEVAAEHGVRPLSDHLWLDLTGGGAPGFLAVTAHGADRMLGLAQVSSANDGVVLEVATRPDDAGSGVGSHDLRDPGLDVDLELALDLADTAIDAVTRRGGGRLTWWVDGADEHTDARMAALAAEHGLAPVRRLYEMRRPLPHPDRAAVTTRSFVPGTDDDAWLTVNNRAFADHGEQGGWTRDTLALRLAEPWFDPDGFRLHEHDGRLLAFCWTKIHHEEQPPVGEIYVIAVDPDAHGRGLGRELTLAGLDSIAARGVTLASLHVDAGNTPALRLYERLGFEVHRTRLAFSGTLGAS